MADDLTEIEERLQHCEAELARLHRDTILFANNGFRSRWESSGPLIKVYATMVEPIPTGLRSQAGMIANEIRACLDALSCVLALRNPTTTNTKGVYFPITKTQEFYSDEASRKIKKLLPRDQGTILKLEPWGGGHPILYLLHEADRMRKHIKLVADSGAAGGFGMGGMDGTGSTMITNKAQANFSALNEEQIVAEIFSTGPSQISLLFRIRYNETPLTNVPVEHLLDDSIRAVREIVSTFN